MTKLITVVTTIQSPTPSIKRLVKSLENVNCPLIVIGDKKGPTEFKQPATEFFSLKDQLNLSFSLPKKLPTGHYARKNIGYLLAFSKGAQSIFETDDDNYPTKNWKLRDFSCQVRKAAPSPWVNVYRLFTKENIWPRGFALDRISDPVSYEEDSSTNLETIQAPIQQGLINAAPDVDAIWRLTQNRLFKFDNNDSVWLPPKTWCPFNSQSTWWWPVAYPLLYLPSFCSNRMTDIWRSFIAQRCLWELNLGLVFHAPEGEQDRNEHNLMKDFEDEIPGYLGNQKITELLLSLKLSKEPGENCNNLYHCYEELSENSFFPSYNRIWCLNS